MMENIDEKWDEKHQKVLFSIKYQVKNYLFETIEKISKVIFLGFKKSSSVVLFLKKT